MTRTFEYKKSPVETPESGISTWLRLYERLDSRAIAEIKKGKYDGIWCALDDFTDIELLPEWNPKLVGLKLQTARAVDVSWVTKLHEMSFLYLEGKLRGKINFDDLSNLEICDVDYCEATAALLGANLSPWRLNVRRLSEPLTKFGTICTGLKGLGIERGTIESLDGIERFSSLESVGLMDLKKLRNIDALAALGRLKELDLTSCNSVENLQVIGKLPKLRKLFAEIKRIPTLQHFRPGDQIEYIRLGERTVVENKDVEIFFRFPKLKKVTFTKKRGYTLNAEQVNERLAQRAV